jgi:hypothetical protein
MYQSANVFVVLDRAPARMVEAQAGKRYDSEREPCLTALWSFHLISSHLISIISMGFGSSLPDVVLSCFFKPTRDFKTTRRDTRAIQI